MVVTDLHLDDGRDRLQRIRRLDWHGGMPLSDFQCEVGTNNKIKTIIRPCQPGLSGYGAGFAKSSNLQRVEQREREHVRKMHTSRHMS